MEKSNSQTDKKEPTIETIPPPISEQAKEYNQLCTICNSWIPIVDFAMHKSEHASKILDFLYLSGADTADWEEELDKRIKCTHILNCAEECTNTFEETGKYKYKKLYLDDVHIADIKKQFVDCWNFIEEAKNFGGKILVHCAMGKSRSASIVMSYLMKYRNMNFKEAYDYVKSVRPVIRPNVGFIKQLRELERDLYGQNSLEGTDILPIYQFYPKKSPAKLLRK